MWDDILLYVIIGFVAQMIDGAIGMAYGVTASSVLLSLGVPPATASACVHAAETFTTGASGFAHWRLGNVEIGPHPPPPMASSIPPNKSPSA